MLLLVGIVIVISVVITIIIIATHYIDLDFFKKALEKVEIVQTDGFWSKEKKSTPEFDRYPPLDRPGPIPEPVDFRFGAIEPKIGKRMKNPITGDHNMNDWPHGIALIINNIQFDQSSEKRDGAPMVKVSR